MSGTEGGSSSSLDERLAMLMAGVERMNAALAKMERQVAQEVASVKQEVGKLATKEDAVAKEVSDLKTEVSNQVAKLATKEALNKLATKEGLKEELANAVGELQSDVRRVQRRVNDVEDDILRAGRRLGAPERHGDSVRVQEMFQSAVGALGGPPSFTSLATGGPPPYPCTKKDMEY